MFPGHVLPVLDHFEILTVYCGNLELFRSVGELLQIGVKPEPQRMAFFESIEHPVLYDLKRADLVTQSECSVFVENSPRRYSHGFRRAPASNDRHPEVRLRERS